MYNTNKLFSTIKLKLGKIDDLNQTLITYNQICQEIIDFGWKEKLWNKNKLHHGTYKIIRESYPKFSSAMVQTARDTASEILKRTLKNKKLSKPIKKIMSSIRYDRRSLNIMFDKKIISINTTFGRIKIPIKIAEYYKKYKDWKYTNAQLLRDKNKIYYLTIQVQKDNIDKKQTYDVLGVDLGINKIAVTSDNKFYNSKHLRNIKGKYQNLKHNLQSIGTKSAKRKLKKISRKETRFVRDVNHCISKKIVNTKYTIFIFEDLKNIRKNTKKYNKKLNSMLGNWSFLQLQSFVEYKANRIGKYIVKIKPNYTSQQCSKCGCIDKKNRNKQIFKCISCNHNLDADLNASRNIARIGRTDFCRLYVNQPNVASNDISIIDDSYKLNNSLI